MPDEPQTNDDALREQLVAYLDGELPDAQCEAIEARLAADEALRVEMQRFDRVWNALDDLPRAEVGDAFTQSTIEMATVEARQVVAQLTAAMPIRRRRFNYAVAGACAGAMLLGFVLVRATMTRGDRMLLEHLGAIYQVDVLEDLDDVRFLRQLASTCPSLLETGDPEQLAEQFDAWRTIAGGDATVRAAWVEAQSDNQKAKILAATRRYARDLSDARREAVQSVYAEMTSAEDRDALFQTALGYRAWLASQTASDQSRLRQMSVDERLAELRRRESAAAGNNRRLYAADFAGLRRAVTELAGTEEVEWLIDRAAREIERRDEQRLRQAQRAGGEEAANRIRQDRAERIARQRQFPAWPIFLLSRFAEGRAGPPDGPPDRPSGAGALRRRAGRDWEVVEAKLMAALTSDTRARFENIRNEAVRRRSLGTAVLESARDAAESIDLEAYFASDSLTNDQRHQLLALPSDQMQVELRRMYLEQELGGVDPEDFVEFGGPPRGGPPGARSPRGEGPPGFRPGRGRPDRREPGDRGRGSRRGERP